MSSSLAYIGELLLQYKYFILVPAIMVDGPIVIMVAGVVVSLGYMNPVTTYIISVCGDVAGDFLRYSLGRWGGQRFIVRWGKYVGFDERHIVAIEEVFQRRTGSLLFVAKFAYGVGSVFHAAAGMARISILKFFAHNLFFSIFKTAILLFIGFYFGHTLSDVTSYLEIIAATLLIILVVGVFFWAYKYGKRSEIKI